MYSAKTAESCASRLLRVAKVARAIADAQAARLEKVDVTAERVLQELARIGFSDIRALFDESGQLKPVHQLTEEAAHALAGIEVVTKHLGDGEVEYVHKVKAWDKPKALEMLAKHLGLLKDQVEISGQVTSVSFGGRYRPDGTKTVAARR